MKDYDTDDITVGELKEILENHKDDEKVILSLSVTNSGNSTMSIGDENILSTDVFNP